MKTIFKPLLNRDFTTLPNALLRNANLSFRARGILAMVLSNHEEWEVSKGWLETMGTEGREAIRAAMAELERAGYVVFVVERNGGQFARQVWTFHSEPVPECDRSRATEGPAGLRTTEPPLYGNPDTGNPVGGLPVSGNPSPSEDNGTENHQAEVSAPARKAAKGEHPELIALWTEHWKQQHGSAYPFGPRDAQAAKTLLRQFGTKDAAWNFIKACVARASEGFPFGATSALYDFANNIARLQAALAKPATRRGARPADDQTTKDYSVTTLSAR